MDSLKLFFIGLIIVGIGLMSLSIMLEDTILFEKEKIKFITIIEMTEIKPQQLEISHVLMSKPNTEFETIFQKGKDYYLITSRKQYKEKE